MTHRQYPQGFPYISQVSLHKIIKSTCLHFAVPAGSWEVTVAFNFISKRTVSTSLITTLVTELDDSTTQIRRPVIAHGPEPIQLYIITTYFPMISFLITPSPSRSSKWPIFKEVSHQILYRWLSLYAGVAFLRIAMFENAENGKRVTHLWIF
jgi:hypothetical protein